MKIWLIVNRITGEQRRVLADNAQTACEKCGWMIGYCYVKELT
jgi:hypothetical protein